jgi:hypothetical protein
MSDFKKQLDQIISSTQRKLISENKILPVKTDQGIQVGAVLIKCQGHLKDLYKNGQIVYREISLNIAAIKLANMMALDSDAAKESKIYQADQEYSKWYQEGMHFKSLYYKSVKNQRFDQADIYWTRFSESKIKAASAKKTVERLCSF